MGGKKLKKRLLLPLGRREAMPWVSICGEGLQEGKRHSYRDQGVLQYHHPPGGVSTVLANVSPTESCDGAPPASSWGLSA